VTSERTRPDATHRWRLFIALPVPRGAARSIATSLAGVAAAFPAARWIDPSRYHVTLRFLGPVDPARVDALAAALEACAESSRPFGISATGGGGTGGRSAAAWLELDDGRAAVMALADRLDELLPADIRAGLRPGRPAPHLTVARRASAELIRALRDGAPAPTPVTWTADAVVLFRSHTGTPAGSSYEPIAQAVMGDRAAA
jgi:2'-5' RNA ligase